MSILFLFLFFLSFSLNIFVSFVSLLYFDLAPCFCFVFQFVLQLVLFLTCVYYFWFPLLAKSIYCTLFLLDCFDFAYGSICIFVYSVTLFTVVINLCLYIGPLQSCAFLFLPCSQSLMYINLLHLPLFNFVCLPFPSLPLNICQFCIHCFIPHLAPCFSLVFQFVLYLVQVLTGKYNFLFPLFTGLIYCRSFLLDCFAFAHGFICICVYSMILIIFA